MNIAIGVVSPRAAWVLPRRFVDGLRREFPQHTFLDAWDRETLRRVLADADAAFAAFVDEDLVALADPARVGFRRLRPASLTSFQPSSPRAQSSSPARAVSGPAPSPSM